MRNVDLKEELNRDTADVLIEYQNDGLTNQNFIISSGNKKYVIRIGGKNSAVLGINRYAEYAVMKAVAKIGVGADLIYFSITDILWYYLRIVYYH